jgi:pSer/pThr/pTyr-binding forkhead associated (FHA) protein
MSGAFRIKNLATETTHELTEEGIIIGREETCSIPLNSKDVSRHHASIKIQNGAAHLTDMNSTNGTLLNKWRIRSTEKLQHGDVITIADFSFVFIEPGKADDITVQQDKLAEHGSFALEEHEDDATSFHIEYPQPPGWEPEDAPAPVVTSNPNINLMNDLLRLKKVDASKAQAAFMELAENGRNTLHLVPPSDKSSFILGRSRACEIHFDDHTVSSQHATLECADGGYEIKDLGSRNGIKVNGTSVATSSLKSGDTVELGRFTLLFKIL